jgi:Ca2+-transporting ATPase
MKEPPRPRSAPILDSELKTLIFIIGISTDLLLLALFYWLLRGFLHLAHIQTLMFVALGINSLFYIYACRSLRQPLFRMKFWDNKLLNLSVLIGLTMLLAAVYIRPLQVLLKTEPLDARNWLVLLAIGVFNLAAIEIAKLVFIIKRQKAKIDS